MAKNVNRTALLFSFFVLCVSGLIAVSTAADETAMQKECAEQLQKVMDCLSYAQGETTTPSSQCCRSVKDIKEKDPKCLCYIIQQAHGGSSQIIKNLGIQEAKLLQLPSACNLQNASISYCVKLLGLSPDSPDAAIFTSNNSTAAAPTTPTSTKESAYNSDGIRHGTFLVGPTAVIALAIFFYAFPTGAASVFCKWG